MMTRYTCALNGAQLHDVDERIHITDVKEPAPRLRITTAAVPVDGLRLLRSARESVTVQVTFLIREYDVVQRRTVLQNVCAWAARGGVLTTGDRPGQQLHVRCTGLPQYGAMAWLDEMILTFTAYDVPFWEQTEAVKVTASDSAELLLPGTAEHCPVNCTVQNAGDAPLTQLHLQSGDTALQLEGLQIEPGAEVTAAVEDGHLRIHSGGESLLHCRTAESSDLLLGRCGESCAVSVSGDQPVLATFWARGRFL